ncbi:MAG: sugar phosphate isomerase/epimerase family protein [Planctomycetota bacterium]
MWKPGFVSHGLLDHSIDQAMELLSSSGYSALGITLGPAHLDPWNSSAADLEALRKKLEEHQLLPSIETGGRYLLDPRKKHWPTLASATEDGRKIRQSFYIRAIDIAVALGAPVVSVWSGGNDDPTRSADEVTETLIKALLPVLDHAESKGIIIGFEPEPGMWIESLEDWKAFRQQIDHSALGLTVDLGHLGVTEFHDPLGSLKSVLGEVIHVHVDDCKDRKHEHLPLGEGELDLPALIGALTDSGYQGQLLVELSRDSHRAPELVEQSKRYLEGLQGG